MGQQNGGAVPAGVFPVEGRCLSGKGRGAVGAWVADTVHPHVPAQNRHLLKGAVQHGDAAGGHRFAHPGVVVAGDVKAGPAGRQGGERLYGTVRGQLVVQNVSCEHHQVRGGGLYRVQQLPLARSVIAAVQVGDASQPERGRQPSAVHRVKRDGQGVVQPKQHKYRHRCQQDRADPAKAPHGMQPSRAARSASSIRARSPVNS